MEYSVIVPVYNESKSLAELSDRIYSVFKGMDKEKNFEVLFVDDGSTDSSREILRGLCNEKPYVRSIFLRSNFGKSFALTSGFIYAEGVFIITIDGDLQDRPEEISKMIEKIKEGYDLVSGWRQMRQMSIFRTWGSWLFNRIVSCIGGVKLHDINCGLKIYKARVAKSLSIYGQHYRFIPLLANYEGFKIAETRVLHDKRKYGTSKYPAFRYQGFFDLLSILFIYKYKFSPLYFFGTLGLVLIIPSSAAIIYIAFRHTLFVLGIGENYITKISLLLPLSTTICILGVSIFLIGFLCDFILCHLGKNNAIASLQGVIEETVNCKNSKNHKISF